MERGAGSEEHGAWSGERWAGSEGEGRISKDECRMKRKFDRSRSLRRAGFVDGKSLRTIKMANR